METKPMRKSQRNIINAFLEMRASMPLEKIKVSALCEKAGLNKSTFYSWYHDIFDLSRSLQEEVIDRIAETLPSRNFLTKNPGQFTKEILMAYEANKTMIQTLFSGSQSSVLPKMIKEKIMNLLDGVPVTLDHEQLETLVNYKIYGAYYAFIQDSGMNEMDKIEFISRLSGEMYKG